MKIAIIDYGAGNVQSVKFALNRLGFDGMLTNNPHDLSFKKLNSIFSPAFPLFSGWNWTP